MHKFNILLFFLIFEFTFIVKSQEPDVLYEAKIEAGDAAQFLHTLEPGKALPLVLFRNSNKTLFLPMNLNKVESLKGKMVQGTEFTVEFRGTTQMLFCPKSEKENCLVATTFEKHEFLECASEPIPVSEPEYEKCGKDKIGSSHKFVYRICRGQDEIDTKDIPFYEYCYDANRQQTLFTVHTIHSLALLKAKLLLREREMTYPIIMNDGTKISIKGGPDGMEEYDPPTSKLSSPKSRYQWRKLVPTEDLALALWRKPTYHEKNFALQHEKLVKIWDDIGEYIRFNAIQSSAKNTFQAMVFTGVIDLKSESEIKNDVQLNIWVKLIMKMVPVTSETSYASQGIAILMNNFIDTETSLSSSSNPDGIETYCDQDVCTESLKDKFKNINGNVRCCLVTPKILDLFNHKHIDVEELLIRKLNFGEDQEILKDEENDNAKEQPVESLREIQQHEILPIILYLHRAQNEFVLRSPKIIQQITTKNKRIVNGSRFFTGDVEKQVHFCPTEDPNETCLEPRKFNRFEPLQCTKRPTPAITETQTLNFDEKIKCGADGNGTLYGVVYKFCTNTAHEQSRQFNDMKFYEFCYDSTKQKIVYTRHKLISSKLLDSKLLFWERKVEFATPTDTQLPMPLSNLKELQDAIKEENESSTLPTDVKKSAYKLQKLVPSEDMAFASWKIPTSILVNLAFQHESLISLWTGINRYVTDYIKTARFENIFIYNGVFDIPNTSLGADQKSQMWFKIIHKKHDFRDEGIVILMQNYLTLNTGQSMPSNSEENTLKRYCEKDSCLKKFQREFNKIGGQVRCCRLTTKIAGTFGIPDVNDKTIVLRIRGIITN